MRRIIKFHLMLLILLLIFSQCSHKIDIQQQLNEFFNKEEVTILVTDSGLGGLSVAADIASRLPQSGIFQNARIVFFNSLFHNRSGYNSLKQEKEKIRIFNIALKAMHKKYKPDLLLIACNTLSVLYDKTPFSKKAPFPVVGIVETGVDLIVDQFEKSPQSTALIFATKTTIRSNSHKNRLIECGYTAHRIIGQECHRLAGCIERGHDSEETIALIKQYVAEAIEKLEDKNAPVFASFNCTHYGYSLQQFKEAFAEVGYPGIEIIDPNPMMADFLFKSPHVNRYPATNVKMEIVSRVKISNEKITSLGGLLDLASVQTADALRNYQYNPGLFHPKFDTTKIAD